MIQPRTLKGFRDFLPDLMLPRERLVETATDVYRSYGFCPIDTPALEYLEILLVDTGLIAIDAPPKQWVMEKAAEHLYADYTTDENLTAFTQLDCEDFYEAR